MKRVSIKWMVSIVILASLPFFFSACDDDSAGDDDNSALQNFTGGECKKEAASSDLKMSRQTKETQPGDDYMGLTCIKWDASTQNVWLLNFAGACGADWHGKADLNQNELTLSIVNPQCLVAACGSCIYDWSFSLSQFDTTAPLSLSIAIDTCPGEQKIEVSSATLPVDSESSGILCNWADWGALQWHAMETDTAGSLNMPCRDEDWTFNDGEELIPCDDGLVCTAHSETDENTTICMKPCETDDDCTPSDALACDDGLCRPFATW